MAGSPNRRPRRTARGPETHPPGRADREATLKCVKSDNFPVVALLPSIPSAPVEPLLGAGAFLLRNLIPIAIVTGTAVSVYTFGYKRPELILEVELSGADGPRGDGHTRANLMLLLANVGSGSAEEVQMTVTAGAFAFDNDIEPTDTITAAYEPPQAVMEIRGGRKVRFFGGGCRHDVFLENVVYEGDVQELWLGSALFTDGEHELKYLVSCK